MATAKALPPIPKPIVAVRMTGLAMIRPMVLANAVGKPTLPRFRCSVSLSLIDMVRILKSGFLSGII
jgi:hypothetical protein